MEHLYDWSTPCNIYELKSKPNRLNVKISNLNESTAMHDWNIKRKLNLQLQKTNM